MLAENRLHPRFSPEGLLAAISIQPLNIAGTEINIQGTVMDMSYSGIRIKLFEPMPKDVPESTIKINITLPDTGIPITIKGVIKHLKKEVECGLKYTNQFNSLENNEHEIDDLMFECIKRVTPSV